MSRSEIEKELFALPNIPALFLATRILELLQRCIITVTITQSSGKISRNEEEVRSIDRSFSK